MIKKRAILMFFDARAEAAHEAVKSLISTNGMTIYDEKQKIWEISFSLSLHDKHTYKLQKWLRRNYLCQCDKRNAAD